MSPSYLELGLATSALAEALSQGATLRAAFASAGTHIADHDLRAAWIAVCADMDRGVPLHTSVGQWPHVLGKVYAHVTEFATGSGLAFGLKRLGEHFAWLHDVNDARLRATVVPSLATRAKDFDTLVAFSELALLVGVGCPPLQAIKALSEDAQSIAVKRELQIAHSNMTHAANGTRAWRAFEGCALPMGIVRALRIGEELGALDIVLRDVVVAISNEFVRELFSVGTQLTEGGPPRAMARSGEAPGLYAAVETVCRSLGIVIDADRAAVLAQLESESLKVVLDGLVRRGRWEF